MTGALRGLAESIATEHGLVWKIWTENEATGESGGINLFTDRASAEAYLAMHTKRLMGFGVPRVDARILDVNRELSAIDRAPVQAPDSASFSTSMICSSVDLLYRHIPRDAG